MAGGVFCLEGQWHRDLRERSSVLPTLDLLERVKGTRYIHKDVATTDEFAYFVERWLQKQYDAFNVGFFAMHGAARELYLTDRVSVSLDEVADLISGRCAGRMLYFGSCSVMRASDATLAAFADATGADLVCGYTREIDWLESAAFETVLLDVLTTGRKSNSVEQRMGAERWAALAANLGFRIVYNNGRTWRPSAARIPAQTVRP